MLNNTISRQNADTSWELKVVINYIRVSRHRWWLLSSHTRSNELDPKIEFLLAWEFTENSNPSRFAQGERSQSYTFIRS